MKQRATGLVAAFLAAGFAVQAGASPGDLITSFSGTVYGLALNPNNAQLYASTDTSVLVIDTVSLRLVASIPVSGAPRGLAVSPDGTRLYVATTNTTRLVVLDIPSLTLLDPIPLPYAAYDVEAGNGGRLYATPGNIGSYRGIMQIDATTGSFVREFTEGVFVYYSGLLEISPDRNFLYFANRFLSPGTLAKFDVSADMPVKVYQNPHASLGSNGQDLWLTPTGEYVYYAVGSGNGTYGYVIARIRTFDMTVRGALLTGPYPREITTSPDGAFAYAVHASGHIDVWDTETQTQLTQYATSGEATELIVDRSGNHLFASFPGGLRVYEAEGSAPLVDEDDDGVDDAVDNCPGVSNPGQEDADQDDLGDACDEFPDEANHDLAMCRLDLDAATADLASCTGELTICLDAVPGDADGDGEIDPTDACPGTPPGGPVDEAGCSREQFCARFTGDTLTCARSDWRNDEPGAVNPGDCRPEQPGRSWLPLGKEPTPCLAD